MSTNALVLVPRRERGWSTGLANMLGKELGAWWRTRRWWVQCLVAVGLMNVTMALNLGNGGIGNAQNSFVMIAALCVPIAAVSMAQDAILGERLSGTAAWVLSKPLRRPAFILAKLVAHGLGLLVTWVAVPWTIAYFQMTSAIGKPWPVGDFAPAVALVYLNMLFYLTLALMLATLFGSRGPVLGISMVVLWAGPMPFITEPIQKYAPWLGTVLPWRLLMPFGNDGPLLFFLASGSPLPTAAPIVATLLWCILFVAVAIWRFGREEF